MTRQRRSAGPELRRGLADRGKVQADRRPPQEPVEPPRPLQLTVSYGRWSVALQDDDILFVECLLADVRRLLEAGGTLIIVGLARGSVEIRSLHQARVFAAQMRALHHSMA